MDAVWPSATSKSGADEFSLGGDCALSFGRTRNHQPVGDRVTCPSPASHWTDHANSPPEPSYHPTSHGLPLNAMSKSWTPPVSTQCTCWCRHSFLFLKKKESNTKPSTHAEPTRASNMVQSSSTRQELKSLRREPSIQHSVTPPSCFAFSSWHLPKVLIRKSAIRACSGASTLKDQNLGQVPRGESKKRRGACHIKKTIWGSTAGEVQEGPKNRRGVCSTLVTAAGLQTEKQPITPSIAQLVEHLTVDLSRYQMVPGSIPSERNFCQQLTSPAHMLQHQSCRRKSCR